MPLFGNMEIAQIIIDSLNFLQCQQRLTLYGYVIMENHLHLIAAAANLSKEIQILNHLRLVLLLIYLRKITPVMYLTN